MKKGLKTLILGILLLLFGIVVIPANMVIGALRLSSDSESHAFLAPGTTEVEVESTGRWTLWNDYNTVYEGTNYQRSPELPDGFEITIRDEAGTILALQSGANMTTTRGSHSSSSIGHIVVKEPGTLVVEVKGDAEPRVLSLSSFDFNKLMRSLFGGIALAVILFLAGIALTIWGVIKLSSKTPAPNDVADWRNPNP